MSGTGVRFSPGAPLQLDNTMDPFSIAMIPFAAIMMVIVVMNVHEEYTIYKKKKARKKESITKHEVYLEKREKEEAEHKIEKIERQKKQAMNPVVADILLDEE